MTEPAQCEAVRELLPELAAGVASGDERARALAHLTGCPGCRQALADAATLVDDLTLLAPEYEPSPGFESRVLAALPPAPAPAPARRRRLLRPELALRAAAVVLLAALAAGLTWWQTGDDRRLAAH